MEEIDQPLQGIFADHVDTVYRTLDTLQPGMQRAVDMLCRSMLDERKLLVCGHGVSAALAQAFCGALLSRNRLERPGLPVIAIGADCVSLGAIDEGYGAGEVYSRQVQALAQGGDTLLLIGGMHGGIAFAQAVRAAHARNARVIAITAGERTDLGSALQAEDLELRIPSDDPPRVMECQLLMLNALCALIELQLFGAT